MAEIHKSFDFNEWRQFTDRTTADRAVGPACQVQISGRCTKCWGPIKGQKDSKDGRWIGIECRVCRQKVQSEVAEQEVRRMLREVDNNIPEARIGRGAVYHEESRFVLKILPDMDRDKAQFEQRVTAAKQAGTCGGWLGREDFPKGTPGYLYAQAHALVSALNNLPGEMSAISLSDFDFGEPENVGVDTSTGDGRLRMSAMLPVTHRRPSDVVMMERMGTALVAGMVAAFACEVGMKALLITRNDKAEKTHDLLKLYQALPADSQMRLEADFSEIRGILKDSRHKFGKWRYFESRTGGESMLALVNTEQVWKLGKTARVIVDECVVAGLQHDISSTAHFDVSGDLSDVSTSTQICLQVTGHESAIPWDKVMGLGRGS